MRRTGVLILCIRPSPELERLAAPLCPYHDVYLVPDAENLPFRAPLPDRPGLVSLRSGTAERLGFRGTVSWLPRRASSRCKALCWLAHGEADEAAEATEAGSSNIPPPAPAPAPERWWMLEEDVLVPTEATLLALDAAHPGADLLSPHHHVRHGPKNGRPARDAPHWSGLADWPHWRLAVGIARPPLASSMVCGVRISRALVRRVADMAAAHGRLLFCEMLFNTLALQHGLAVQTPPQLAGILWRQPRYTASFPFRPDGLYHPVKRLTVQLQVRERCFREVAAWRAFAERWVGEASEAGEAAAERWGVSGGREPGESGGGGSPQDRVQGPVPIQPAAAAARPSQPLTAAARPSQPLTAAARPPSPASRGPTLPSPPLVFRRREATNRVPAASASSWEAAAARASSGSASELKAKEAQSPALPGFLETHEKRLAAPAFGNLRRTPAALPRAPRPPSPAARRPFMPTAHPRAQPPRLFKPSAARSSTGAVSARLNMKRMKLQPAV
jgi:hypothetical protein